MLQSITVPTAGQLAEDRALGLGVVSGITSWGQWDSLGPVPGDRERMMHAACLGAASTTEPFGFTTDIRFTQLGRGRDQSSLLSDLHLQNPRIPSARCFSSSALSPSCCGLCWCPALGCPAFPSQQCSHPTQHTQTQPPALPGTSHCIPSSHTRSPVELPAPQTPASPPITVWEGKRKY